jgi:ankyrin repeat protein
MSRYYNSSFNRDFIKFCEEDNKGALKNLIGSGRLRNIAISGSVAVSALIHAVKNKNDDLKDVIWEYALENCTADDVIIELRGKEILDLEGLEINEILDFLVKRGADIEARGRTFSAIGQSVLHNAVMDSNHLLVKSLIERGANVFLNDFNENTALTIAKTKEVIDVIMDLRPEIINYSDRLGHTVLMNLCAAKTDDKNLEAIEHLILKEINVESRDSHGETALRKCYKDEAKLDLLLRYGANINNQDEEGVTALMEACRKGDHKLVSRLLSLRADPNIFNLKGKTAFDYVQSFMPGHIDDEEVARVVLDNFSREDLRRDLYPKKFFESLKMLMGDGVAYIELYSDILKGSCLDEHGKFQPYFNKHRDLVKKVRNFIHGYKSIELQLNLAMAGFYVVEAIKHIEDDRIISAFTEAGVSKFVFEKFLKKHPYLTNEEDEKNLEKDFFICVGLAKAVENSKWGGKYPLVKLNKDNSISFFTEIEYPAGLSSSEVSDLRCKDIRNLRLPYIALQLEYWAYKYGFKPIGGRHLVESIINEDSGIEEVKINLSPDELDKIMHNFQGYAAYKGDGSLLSLNHNISIKPGTIRMFPVFPLDDEGKLYSTQVAGCQFSEIPSLQLMHFLPNYKSEIEPRHRREGFHFHWNVAEVVDDLQFGSNGNFSYIIDQLFKKNGFLITENGHHFCEYPDLMAVLDSGLASSSAISIVPMDEESKNFYAMYGNISHEKLDYCLSVEVRVVDLLQELDRWIEDKIRSLSFMTDKKSRDQALFSKYSFEESVDEASNIRNIRDYFSPHGGPKWDWEKGLSDYIEIEYENQKRYFKVNKSEFFETNLVELYSLDDVRGKEKLLRLEEESKRLSKARENIAEIIKIEDLEYSSEFNPSIVKKFKPKEFKPLLESSLYRE